MAVVLFAALLGTALALWQLHAKMLRQESQVEDAQLPRARAERGDAAAQAELCHLNDYGLGVPRDRSQGLHWCQMAAQQGNAWGEEGVAAIYYGGYGVPRDYNQAFQWFQKAAGQHLATAEYWLAVMYLRGFGGPENDSEVFRWHRQAADQHDPNPA
ncbi:MAG TPA: tetratricopeptide repeat protein [Acidobacteriaceae bacterium]|nr:tetratricopeptide repeat protein [Acidobacteriaceae bacterium]